MAQPIGVKALARLTRVTPRAVRTARAAGHLVADSRNQFDPENARNAAWIAMRQAKASHARNRDLDAKIAAAVAKLRLAQHRYEVAREKYVDRAEAVRIGAQDAGDFIAALRQAPAEEAAAFAAELRIDIGVARRILDQFIELAIGELGDLKAEAIRAAQEA
jgi:hypothetical protein